MEVRFNLEAGPYCQQWEIRRSDGSKSYVDPATHDLFLTGCTLVNNAATSRRIHRGKGKVRCAWVECESVMPFLRECVEFRHGEPVMFNPRVAPYWRDADGECLDGRQFDRLVSCGRSLHTVYTPA